ncbi:MAG: hypothetical protein WC511_01900 [Candidatus Pacearchaeota archaeon]
MKDLFELDKEDKDTILFEKVRDSFETQAISYLLVREFLRSPNPEKEKENFLQTYEQQVTVAKELLEIVIQDMPPEKAEEFRKQHTERLEKEKTLRDLYITIQRDIFKLVLNAKESVDKEQKS